MNSLIARILTGICGGLIMAAINHWVSFSGWSYAWSIIVSFIFFFLLAWVFENYSKNSSDIPGKSIGSHNKTSGKQRVYISNTSLSGDSGSIGSSNTAQGDQTIRIK